MTRRRRDRHGRHEFKDWFKGTFGRKDRGEPWGWRRKFFESGEVRIALLSLLAERPMHGYELMKEMESRSGGTYKASAGTIYPNLQMLEDQGLIQAETNDAGKKVFSVTDEGQAELEREKATVDRIWQRASAWDGWRAALQPGAEELAGPAIRLVRAAFSAVSDADAQQLEKVRSVLVKAAEEIEAVKGGNGAAPAAPAEDFG